MELYNFFTKPTCNQDDVESLKYIFEELKPICYHVQIVKHSGNDADYYSIIGQMYGEDTNVGDTELLGIFGPMTYVWFDAFCPGINNISY